MKLKRLTAILLVGMMTASLAACASTSSKNTTESTTAADSTTATDTTTTTEASSEAEATVDLKDAPTLTIFVDESWWPYDTWEGAIPEEFSKRVGVNIQVIRAADDNQLPLMVASGDMPDIICSWRYQYLANSDVSYSLNELQEENPSIDFDVNPIYEFVNQASDGQYYTIGTGYSPDSELEQYDSILTEGPGFMVRQDLMEEMGLEINTLEDLDTVFAAAKETYPDMVTCSFNSSHKFNWLMVQMGLKNGGYYDNDGSLIWYLRQDGMLDYYKKVNEWYRKGYVTAENFAFQSEDETKEICVAGKSFANFGYDNHADNYNTAIAQSGGDFKFSLITKAIGENCTSYNTNNFSELAPTGANVN